MLPDLHVGFSRGRSGGLVFPSLSEFSTLYCDLHSQRLWHSQSRNRCFSGTLLLFWWSRGCWQFDLWFLCLFGFCNFKVIIIIWSSEYSSKLFFPLVHFQSPFLSIFFQNVFHFHSSSPLLMLFLYSDYSFEWTY